MPDFDKIMLTLPSEGDREKMIALPYRIGLFVSHADTTGGWEAQEAEMQSLNNILRSFTEDFCKSEFVQGLLMQTLASRAQWPGWSHQLDSVPAECVAAMYDLRGVLDKKHLAAFQEMMMEIAFAVAQAFREARQVSQEPKGSWLNLILGKPRKARFEHMSISATERAALHSLADALDYERE